MLKEQAKAAASLVKARAGSATGSYRGKPGTSLDGSSKGAKDSKEAAKKVRKVFKSNSFLLEILINRNFRGLENQLRRIL